MRKLTSILLLLALSLTLASCNGTATEQTSESSASTTSSTTTTAATTETTPAETEPAPAQPIPVAEGKVGRLSIVLPAGDCRNTTYAKDKLTHFIQNTTGAELACGTSPEGEYALLLGDTGLDESTALKSTLTGNSYAIKIDGNRILLAATSPAFLYDAVDYLIEHLLTVEGDTVTLNTTSLDYVGQGDTSSLRHLFTESDALYSTIARADGWPDEIVKKPDDTQHTQGGCSDGEYVYQAFIYKDTASNEQNNVCRIVKIKPDFDPNTQNVVKMSAPLDLNHTNDITYNSRTHELVVCHNNPYRTKLTVLDPDTLTVKRTVTIKQNIYSLSYDASRDVYAVGMSGGQNMILFDGELANTVSKVYPATPKTSGYTTQGICSDDTFIYHTLWNSPGSTANSNKNVITVYDWYGNYVGMIYTKIAIESENIFLYDGALCVSAYSSGGKASYLYRIEPKLP